MLLNLTSMNKTVLREALNIILIITHQLKLLKLLELTNNHIILTHADKKNTAIAIKNRLFRRNIDFCKCRKLSKFKLGSKRIFSKTIKLLLENVLSDKER